VVINLVLASIVFAYIRIIYKMISVSYIKNITEFKNTTVLLFDACF